MLRSCARLLILVKDRSRSGDSSDESPPRRPDRLRRTRDRLRRTRDQFDWRLFLLRDLTRDRGRRSSRRLDTPRPPVGALLSCLDRFPGGDSSRPRRDLLRDCSGRSSWYCIGGFLAGSELGLLPIYSNPCFRAARSFSRDLFLLWSFPGLCSPRDPALSTEVFAI